MQVCDALPAFHAFTGGDYSPAFNRKGKVRPFNKMISQPQTLKAFANLGHDQEIDQHDSEILEEFVCSIYCGQNVKCKKVNEARLEILQKSLPKRHSKALKTIKSVDPAMLPPCFKVLEQRIKRTNLITH